MADAEQAPAGVDSTRPSPARLYDYYLDGTHNFEADRQAAEHLRTQLPELAEAAWANRGFHGRAAAWIAAECGIRQFIDIGPGLPTQNNTHQVVRGVARDARVVYVDIDPLVAAYATELLPGDGSTTLITADLRDPAGVLSHPDLRRLIDFGQPAGILMSAVMHFVSDEEDPCGLVAQYLAATAPGSYLALSHATYENLPPRAALAIQDVYASATNAIYLRSMPEIGRFFDGLDLVPPRVGAGPGLSYVGSWRPADPGQADSAGSRVLCGGVARRR